jgi:hypothetical protein
MFRKSSDSWAWERQEIDDINALVITIRKGTGEEMKRASILISVSIVLVGGALVSVCKAV